MISLSRVRVSVFEINFKDIRMRCTFYTTLAFAALSANEHCLRQVDAMTIQANTQGLINDFDHHTGDIAQPAILIEASTYATNKNQGWSDGNDECECDQNEEQSQDDEAKVEEKKQAEKESQDSEPKSKEQGKKKQDASAPANQPAAASMAAQASDNSAQDSSQANTVKNRLTETAQKVIGNIFNLIQNHELPGLAQTDVWKDALEHRNQHQLSQVQKRDVLS